MNSFGTFTPTEHFTINALTEKYRILSDNVNKSVRKTHIIKCKKSMTKQKKGRVKKTRDKSSSTITTKAILLALKSNRVPSENISHRSKEDGSSGPTGCGGSKYKDSLRGSVQSKHSDSKPKVPYKSTSRKYYKVLQEKQPFLMHSRGRNDPVIGHYPNKTLSSRYSERKCKVMAPTATSSRREPCLKASTTFVQKDKDQIALSSSYNYASFNRKKKLTNGLQSSTARSNSKKSIDKSRYKHSGGLRLE
jgi:hypothetical protein